MIELTAQDGSPLFVNPDAIWHVRGNGAGGSAIYASSGAALFVKGSAHDIATLVMDWRAERSEPDLHRIRDPQMSSDNDR